MANTYTQIYIHTVLAVQNRTNLISNMWKNELYQYIGGIIRNNKHKMLAINGMPDHLHILIGMKPHQALSVLLQDIKGSSSKWINEKMSIKGKFNWQSGYCAFSYSRSQLTSVIRYIQEQEKHHKKYSFKEEYLKILKLFNLEYEEKYLFKWIDA